MFEQNACAFSPLSSTVMRNIGIGASTRCVDPIAFSETLGADAALTKPTAPSHTPQACAAAPMIEFAGVLSGVLAVWLTTRQNVWCWPVGIVSVALFVLVFYQARLYAAAGLQVAYIALAIYGWYSWTRGGPGHQALRVARVTGTVLAVLLVAGAAVGAGLGSWLAFRTNAAVPWVDAAATSYSLVAQFMQTRKWIESWLLWIAIDVVYVGMYVSQGLSLTALLYAMYLGLAVLGWREWRRSLVARS